MKEQSLHHAFVTKALSKIQAFEELDKRYTWSKLALLLLSSWETAHTLTLAMQQLNTGSGFNESRLQQITQEVDSLLAGGFIDVVAAYRLYRISIENPNKSQDHLLEMLKCIENNSPETDSEPQDPEDETPFEYDPDDHSYPNCHYDCEYCNNYSCAQRIRKSLNCETNCCLCARTECGLCTPF